MVPPAKIVFIAAAGTGGHIFPALAIAKELQSSGYKIYWIGTKHGMENRIIANHPYPLIRIGFGGVRNKGLLRWLKLPFDLLASSLILRQQIKKQTPARQQPILLVMGGYVSVPAALAAKTLGMPIALHEQNAIAGLANSLIALFADAIFQGFNNAFIQQHLQIPLLKQRISNKLHNSGNPIRTDIANLTPTAVNRFQRILILGGSLGALSLNRQLPTSLHQWQQRTNVQLQITHQCGKDRSEAVKQVYQQLNLFAEASDFINDMAKIYAEADLIIARAGASTIAEIAHLGKPAILIPYPHAVNNHQYANAQWLQRQQPCVIIEDKDLNNQSLCTALSKLERQLPYQKIQSVNVSASATTQIKRLIDALAP